MKKALKVVALLLALAVCFLLGWRVMPRVWPTIKTQVVYRVLPQLQVRTVAIQSLRDELVSDISVRDLEANPSIRVVKMEQAGHFGYEGEEQERMLKEFRELIADFQ